MNFTPEALKWYKKHKKVMEAHTQGKKIQYRLYGAWTDATAPSWDTRFEYRVKPEPKVIFCRVFDDGSVSSYTQAGLDKYREPGEHFLYKKYIEVIDDES